MARVRGCGGQGKRSHEKVALCGPSRHFEAPVPVAEAREVGPNSADEGADIRIEEVVRMATYVAFWRVEFDADSDEEAREHHEQVLVQTDDVDASIYVDGQPTRID